MKLKLTDILKFSVNKLRFKIHSVLFVLFLLLSLIARSQSLDLQIVEAAKKGDEKELSKLIRLKANVNAKNEDGITPLMFASEKGFLNCVKVLIKNKADINLLPDDKTSALHSAVKFNHLEIADTLILCGANLEQKDNTGFTPIMYSVAYGFYDMTDLLLYYGAKINLPNNSDTPLGLAAFYNDTAIAKNLINHKANVNLKNTAGATPLILAATKDNSAMVQLLLENKAKTNLLDSMGFSALLIATRNNCTKAAELLAKANPDFEINSKDGNTALIYAIKNKNYRIVNALVENGAKLNYPVTPTSTPLSLSRVYRNDTIIKFLRKKGAKYNSQIDFKKVGIGFVQNFNLYDYMLGGEISIYEVEYGFSLTAGFITRPVAKKILFRERPTFAYQFIEKRNLLYLDLKKQLIIKYLRKSDFGIEIGAKGIYSIGSYKGSNRALISQYKLAPTGGIFIRSNYWGASASYEYVDFNSYQNPPHRFTITGQFFIPQIRKY